MTFRPFLLFALAIVTASPTVRADEKLSAKEVEFFEKKIRPVLVKHCYRCHSPQAERIKSDLDLSTREGTLKGGEIGPAVVPGNLETSLLMQALRYEDDLEMPPNEQLPEDVIDDFKEWIEMGAPDPRDAKQKDGEQSKLPTPTTDWWSLQPVKQPTLPTVQNKTWPRTDVDRFILADLEKKNLQPVADAEPLALLRRVHYDLTGLPPTPEVIAAFQKDHSPEVFVKIVDGLLQSPQFGERWGRHWLDVARFAESNGKDRDAVYPHAWRYRRYVIKSFNEDKRYDQFIREQIAGDLMPAKDPFDAEEKLIATGFLALGPKPIMGRGEKQLMDIADDQIDATSRAVLGLTVSCARCHDHKFDPIPTKDYYSLAGIFRSTKTFYGSNQKNPSNLLVLADEKGEKVEQPKPAPQVNRAEIQKQLRQARNRLKKVQAGNAANKQVQVRRLNQEIKQLQAQVRSAGGGAPGGANKRYAMGVNDAKPMDLNVFVRGEVGKRGPLAPRGFLSSIKIDRDIKVSAKQSGRLELAQWLTEPTNPLTARVAANRVWHHLFGRGIVRTTDNLGANGELPTNSELLDHLASAFVEDGWSTKKLVRRIVRSRAYQLGAIHDEKNYLVDPDNTFVWRHTLRRLDVESIRDTVLAASGKLDLTPPKTSPVARVGYGEVGRGINTRPIEEPFYHRSVYLPILRTSLLEILKVFDFAEPSLVVGQRTITTVPAQALYLMNSPFIVENSQTLAELLLKEKMSDGERIELAHQRCFARNASDKEQQRALTYLSRVETKLQESTKDESERKRLAWASYCQALFATAELRYLN